MKRGCILLGVFYINPERGFYKICMKECIFYLLMVIYFLLLVIQYTNIFLYWLYNIYVHFLGILLVFFHLHLVLRQKRLDFGPSVPNQTRRKKHIYSLKECLESL